jgi:hypothetical protein
MKVLIILVLIFSNSFEAEAAKPKPPSEAPFTFTVEAYDQGIYKIGKNLQWTKHWTYQDSARELFANVPYLFTPNSVTRFLVEWPREGYPSFNIYGCIGANRTLVLVSGPNDCP